MRFQRPVIILICVSLVMFAQVCFGKQGKAPAIVRSKYFEKVAPKSSAKQGDPEAFKAVKSSAASKGAARGRGKSQTSISAKALSRALFGQSGALVGLVSFSMNIGGTSSGDIGKVVNIADNDSSGGVLGAAQSVAAADNGEKPQEASLPAGVIDEVGAQRQYSAGDKVIINGVFYTAGNSFTVDANGMISKGARLSSGGAESREYVADGLGGMVLMPSVPSEEAGSQMVKEGLDGAAAGRALSGAARIKALSSGATGKDGEQSYEIVNGEVKALEVLDNERECSDPAAVDTSWDCFDFYKDGEINSLDVEAWQEYFQSYQDGLLPYSGAYDLNGNEKLDPGDEQLLRAISDRSFYTVREMADCARALKPEFRILFMKGYKSRDPVRALEVSRFI